MKRKKYIKKGYNEKSLNNLKSYFIGDGRAIENGRKGGINSGIKRRYKSITKKKLNCLLNLYNYFDNISEEEAINTFQTEFKEEEKEKIKDIYNMYKKMKSKKHFSMKSLNHNFMK